MNGELECVWEKMKVGTEIETKYTETDAWKKAWFLCYLEGYVWASTKKMEEASIAYCWQYARPIQKPC